MTAALIQEYISIRLMIKRKINLKKFWLLKSKIRKRKEQEIARMTFTVTLNAKTHLYIQCNKVNCGLFTDKLQEGFFNKSLFSLDVWKISLFQAVGSLIFSMFRTA